MQSAKLLMLCFGAGLIIASLWWAVREYLIKRKLQQSGSLLDATIIELGQARWTRNLEYYAIYKFMPDSQSSDAVVRQQAVGWIHYGKLKIGSKVAISFLPENPQISRLAGVDADNSGRDLAILRALVGLVTLVSFLSL